MFEQAHVFQALDVARVALVGFLENAGEGEGLEGGTEGDDGVFGFDVTVRGTHMVGASGIDPVVDQTSVEGVALAVGKEGAR